MPKNHRSFFERLTGSVNTDEENEQQDFENNEIEETFVSRDFDRRADKEEKSKSLKTVLQDEDEEDGQLTVDMFQNPNEIIIQAVVAGVRPDELDVSITQDMVTIHGRRQKQKEISGDDYYYQELYWGGFSRSILLPQEVDSEEAEASLKQGLLTIKLPKLDKDRVQKVKVKNE